MSALELESSIDSGSGNGSNIGIDLRSIIRSIPDFPHEGIMFRDITPILQNPAYLRESVGQIIETIKDVDFSLVAGPESRGFIFGVPVACAMNKGFIPVRKAGKLPYKTVKQSYNLEYGTAEIEIHEDSIKKGEKVVIIDDLLATGGTCKALCELIESIGGEVAGIVFLIELSALNGRKQLEKYKINSILQY